MDLRHLEYFVAVAETGSFTGAADRLAVGQPAVSAAVRRLEDTLDAELFARTRQGVLLTTAGETLLPAARRTLRAAAEARDLVAAVNDGQRGSVRFGNLEMTYGVRIPDLLATFRFRHPLVGTQLLHAGTGAAGLIDHVRHGRLDCAISVSVRQPPPGIRFEPIVSSEYCIHAAADHPRIRGDRVTADDLRNEAFVGSPVGSPERADLDHLLSLLGITPPIPVEVDRLATMFDIVRQSELVALMPRALAGLHPPGVHPVTLTADLPRCSTVAVTPTGRPLSTAASDLLTEVTGRYKRAAEEAPAV